MRVDGAGPHVAEVLTLRQILLDDLPADLLRGLLHFLRVLVRQAVLCQNGVHLGSIITLTTQNVDHLAHHVAVRGIGPLCDAHQRLVVVLAALQLVLRDQHVLHDEVVLRDEERDVASHAQTAHERVLGALQHLQHLSLLDVVTAAGHEREAHAVAVLSPQRVTLGDEDRLVRVVGDDRVLAVGLAHEATLLHLVGGGEAVGGVADLRQHVVPRHILHRLDGEHLQRMRVQPQLAEYLLERKHFLRLLHEQLREHLCQILLVRTTMHLRLVGGSLHPCCLSLHASLGLCHNHQV